MSRKTPEPSHAPEALARTALDAITAFTKNVLEQLPAEARQKVQTVLAAKKAPQPTLSAEQLLEKLQFKAQYERAINALKADPKDDGGILNPEGQAYPGDVAAPTYEEALAVFTPEMLEKAAKMKDSRLVIVPKDFGRIVQALNAHQKRNGLPEAYVNTDIYDAKPGKITGYEVAFVNGSPDMAVKKGDNPDLTLGERVKKRQNKTAKLGLQGMDGNRYGALMLQSLQEGHPIDKETWTILDADKAMTGSRVPYAGWYAGNRQLDFDCNHSGSRGDYGRFRSSVGGDVKTR